ncbi:putative LRR containing protein [Trachipleistophora hominis]|uniref:Putative LRR containing protein n=1 Tax=Trachipleistophora hominis TaxID=72359 RepID=L7K0D9_TRAHO|nr:putative LRR containing protein [Trachipleistophora hominis]
MSCYMFDRIFRFVGSRKNNQESFAIFIRSLSFDKLVIEMNVDTAKFFRVKIAELLLINSQQCNNLIFDQFKGVISIPNVTSLNQLELSDLKELNISSKVIVITRKDGDMDITPIHEDKTLTLPILYSNIHIPTIQHNYCEDIYVSECKFPINIAGILTNITTNESVIQISPEEEFYLTSSCSEVPSKLELVNKRICDIFMIQKNVNFLSLAKITANEGSALRLNNCLESVRVCSSEINIDASNAKNLKAITLTNATSITYNPTIHLLLSYLNISTMNMNHNFDLAPSVRAFLLTNCTITSDFSIRINESISLLSISEFEGLIDMTGVAGLRKMELNRHNTLYFDRCTGTSQGCLLQIENYTFKHSVVFSDDLETIRLKRVETAQGIELVLGRGCKHLELDSPKVAINPSCSMSLEKVTLKNTAFHDIKNLLTALSRVKTLILENVDIEDYFELPGHIHAVILREIRLATSSRFSINRGCNEVRFYHCSGMYDLSKVENLEAFGLIFGLNDESTFKISFPSLDNIRELDIACNLSEEYLKYCLTKCINLQNLTVRSFDHTKKSASYPSLSISKDEVFNSLGNNLWLSQKLSKYELSREHSNNESADLLNFKTNIFICEIFTFNIRNKLKYLNLVGCGLNEENLKTLKKLVCLQTLIVDCAFFSNDIIRNIPDKLTTFEIVDTNIYKHLRANLYNLDLQTMQLLRKHKRIEHMVLSRSIMEYEHIFDCLPVELESLKIKIFSENDVDFCAHKKKKLLLDG